MSSFLKPKFKDSRNGKEQEAQKGFVIVPAKPKYFTGEIVKGRVLFDKKKMIRDSTIDAIGIRFRVEEFFETASWEGLGNNGYRWGKHYRLLERNKLLWNRPPKYRSVRTLFELCVEVVLANFDRHKIDVSSDIREKLMSIELPFSFTIPRHFPPSLSLSYLGFPAEIRYTLQLRTIKREKQKKQDSIISLVGSCDLTVLAYIPNLETPRSVPIYHSGHNQDMTALVCQIKRENGQNSVVYNGDCLHLNLIVTFLKPGKKIVGFRMALIQRVFLRGPLFDKMGENTLQKVSCLFKDVNDCTVIPRKIKHTLEFQVNVTKKDKRKYFVANYFRDNASIAVDHLLRVEAKVKNGKNVQVTIPLLLSDGNPKMEHLGGRPFNRTIPVDAITILESYFTVGSPIPFLDKFFS